MHDLRDDDLYIDANGAPTERFTFGDQHVIVHYDDIPAKDITVVRGIPCTTALRTVIDIAPDCEAGELERIVRDAIERRLFTVDEAWARLVQPDMSTRPGAKLLRNVLRR